MSFKEIVTNFLISLISIVLGVVVTFAGQGQIDRLADRREVRSALELVRTELESHISDINEMSEYLVQEKQSADYFLDNRYSLSKCPADSISLHAGNLFADASISLSQDALELLKNSSLFQKIGDNNLSMKIIRAYDTSASIASTMNRRISDRNDRFEEAVNSQTVDRITTDGRIDIRKYIRTPYGLYTIQWLSRQPDPEAFNDVSDVRDALETIDKYLNPIKKRKKK